METIVKVRYEELKEEYAGVSTTPKGGLILSIIYDKNISKKSS